MNIDSQAPNRVFGAFAHLSALLGRIWSISGRSLPTVILALIFVCECHGAVQFVEAERGHRLRDGRCAVFPMRQDQASAWADARAVQEGYEAAAVFVIQMKQAQAFPPNDGPARLARLCVRRRAGRGGAVCL